MSVSVQANGLSVTHSLTSPVLETSFLTAASIDTEVFALRSTAGGGIGRLTGDSESLNASVPISAPDVITSRSGASVEDLAARNAVLERELADVQAQLASMRQGLDELARNVTAQFAVTLSAIPGPAPPQQDLPSMPRWVQVGCQNRHSSSYHTCGGDNCGQCHNYRRECTFEGSRMLRHANGTTTVERAPSGSTRTTSCSYKSNPNFCGQPGSCSIGVVQDAATGESLLSEFQPWVNFNTAEGWM